MDDARELLGSRNHDAILKRLRQPPKAGKAEPVGKGELRGRALEFRQVTLPGYEAAQAENAIALDSRASPALDPANLTQSGHPAKPVESLERTVATPASPNPAAPPDPTIPAVAQGTAGSAAKALDQQERVRLRAARANAVPEAVASKFLKVDDKYFFPDKKLAFTDRGTKLKAETHNLEVIRSIVAIAEARGWQTLGVTGTPQFRQEVWREATSRGIHVRGHEPTALDNEEMRHFLEKRHGANEIERDARHRTTSAAAFDAGESRLIPGNRPQILELRGRSDQLIAQAGRIDAAFARTSVRMDLESLAKIDGPERHQEALAIIGRNAAAKAAYNAELQSRAPDTAVAAAAALAAAASVAAARQLAQPTGDAAVAGQRPTFLAGKLLEAGAASYKFDPKERLSYYIKLQTDAGERVLWGVDLERALAESKTQPRVGDLVAVENRGSRPVTVMASAKDRDGRIVGDQKVTTHRNAWAIEKPAYFDERAEKAAAFRNGDRAQQQLVTLYPDLTNAIATMRIGELFAEKLIDRPEDRRRLVESLRETLAQAVEHDETIHAPRLKLEAVRKLDRMSGDLDEVAQRAAGEKAARSIRQAGARAMEKPQHARA
ncbi:MAG: LPD7 domain-containing protein [Burkholderiales bacterium]